MDAETLHGRSPSLADAENWLALGAGALLLLVGASRRSPVGACLAVSSVPLLYRGITGRWPDVLNGYAQPDSTRSALGGDRGVHVRESKWELGLQIFTEEQAEGFTFDVLDATKIVPEELVPIVPVGRLVLNRNPDNFFTETEQVAFCVAHVVPGVDFSNDPLLAGRIHSYVDTQISRLGGPDFHEIDATLPDGQPDSGLIIASDADAGTDDFVVALVKHRHYARETDPPRV